MKWEAYLNWKIEGSLWNGTQRDVLLSRKLVENFRDCIWTKQGFWNCSMPTPLFFFSPTVSFTLLSRLTLPLSLSHSLALALLHLYWWRGHTVFNQTRENKQTNKTKTIQKLWKLCLEKSQPQAERTSNCIQTELRNLLKIPAISRTLMSSQRNLYELLEHMTLAFLTYYK